MDDLGRVMDYTEIYRPMPLECHKALNFLAERGNTKMVSMIRADWNTDDMMDESVLRAAIGSPLVDSFAS